MSIKEWYNSQIVKNFRMQMFDQTPNDICTVCYQEEYTIGTSRRHRSNQKSVIFTRTNFDLSYSQSPGFEKFDNSAKTQGSYNGMPIDLHIDLGNYCNLTCKMCNAKSSSSIASQEVKWGITDSKKYVGTDWTRDESVWQKFLNDLESIPGLHNIHFMGGETLISSRFEDLLDYMIEKNRLDLNFSFVTNGTMFNHSVMEKLKKFNRVGIEISVESCTRHNEYQRQGTKNFEVFNNINQYLSYCDYNKITVTIRPAVSALTIGSYYTLLQFCLDQKLLIKSLIVFQPTFYDIKVLPQPIRQQYIELYQDLAQRNQLESAPTTDYNESDPNQYRNIIAQEVSKCIKLLSGPSLDNQHQLLQEMFDHCKKWDQVHGYNARELYPEWKDLLDQYGY